MRKIKPVSRAPFARDTIPAAAIRDPEPWEFWLACLVNPIAWFTGIKRCYCYSSNLPLQY